MDKFRIAFFGNNQAAINCVDVLLKNENVEDIIIITPPGGKLHSWHASLFDFSAANDLTNYSPDNIKEEEFFELIRDFSPDIIFSVYYSKIIPNTILDLAKFKINFHPSILPYYRGTAPIIWAIVNGEKQTGITAHEMTSIVDVGNIYGRLKFDISVNDTGFSLHQKAAKQVKTLFEQIIDKIFQGNLEIINPLESAGSYYSSKTPRVNKLDPLNQTNEQIINIVRALADPLPMAYIDTNQEKFFINKCSHVNNVEIQQEIMNMGKGKGPFIIHDQDTYLITNDGVLKIDDVRVL